MSVVSRRFAVADPPVPLQSDRFVLWIARQQWRTLLGGAAFGIPWMLSIALVPAFIGRAIDDGLVARDAHALVLWAMAVLGLGLISAISTDLRHWFAVHNYLAAVYRASQVAEASMRRTGPALTRRVPHGEVISTFATDVGRMGDVFDVSARFAGAIVSFVVVAVILLRGSTQLGLIMLVGGPLLVASLALVVRPLQRRQADQRAANGTLTTLAADTVGGLRVLRGIGGEDVFYRRYAAQSREVRAAGYRLSGIQALLDAAQVLLPGIFVAVVTAVGAHQALAGRITAGQLVAFYGYTAFLTMPLRTATEFFDKAVRTRVAARRIVSILQVPPDHPATAMGAPNTPNAPEAALVDARSGVVIAPGELTALVSARPEDSADVAHRLGRLSPGSSQVTWGGIPLDQLPIEEVRRAIVVCPLDPHLFSGDLRTSLLAGATSADDDRIRAAIQIASAQDALDAVDGGLDGRLQERGRALSGGQRQRLALARMLLLDPQVLVLIEPTSAVDAHTEARIAERLAAHRSGRTTVIVTASPLLLTHAARVQLLHDGQVVASGTHHDLITANAAYRRVVLRGDDETDGEAPAAAGGTMHPGEPSGPATDGAR